MKTIRNVLIFLTFVIVVINAQQLPDDAGNAPVPRQVDKPDLSQISQIDAESYIVGAGDGFFISIRGVMESNFNVLVNPEGYLFLPKIGLIDVNNKLLGDCKELIEDKIKKSYKSVEIDVSLVSIREVKIDIIGFLPRPGSVTVLANTRLYNLVESISDLEDHCDLRNIKVIHTSGEVKYYDIISYNKLNEEKENPYVSGIKTIVLSKTDQFVTVFGSAINPGTFAYKENESVLHLINLAGGFSSNAKKDTVEVIRFDENNEKLFSIFYKAEDLTDSSPVLSPGDKIVIRKLPEFQIDRMVQLVGEVQFPGMYKLRKNSTSLYEVIAVYAGGFTKDASLKDAYIERSVGIDKPDPELERLKTIPRSDLTEDEYEYLKARSRERKGRMVVDFIALFENKNLDEDVILRRNDVIVVPEKIDYISIVGQVVKPGNIVFNENYQIDDYIKIAGGFSWRAVDDDIRVIKSYSGEWIESDELDKLEPGDIIWVPEEAPDPKFWDVFRDTMLVLGQIAAVITSVVAIAVATR